MPDEGWKVHVSARLDRAQAVLDHVSDACAAEGVSFKHLRAELFFLFAHHKHGAREQAGKFCTAYPPDEQTARRLMDRLASALAGEEGPYTLTDRRYRDSRTVHYRWGAFRLRARRRTDGTSEWLMRDAAGRDRIDARRPFFALPEGMSDPFAEDTAAPHSGPVVLRGYEIQRAIRLSNAGGTYEARELRTGRRVFVKEARAHNGLYWDGSTARARLRREYEALRDLHARAPGVCPEPLDHFREWEHDFLVTEFVDGTPLDRWIARRSPVVQAERTPDDFASYYAACRQILAGLDAALDRVHDAGFLFGDVNPGNLLVTDAGDVRLVDFEAASPSDQPPLGLGAEGYMPARPLHDAGPFAWDEYGAAAIALSLLMPLHQVIARHPASLPLLRRDLERSAPVPDWLWTRATRFQHARPQDRRLPTAEALDSAPRSSLLRLAAETRRALLAMADADHPDRLFPTVLRGYAANTLCLAYGSAGVLHALHLTGDVDDELVVRFRRDALEAPADLPPGLHVGSAGVAWVLAELGLIDEATDMLDSAARHPLLPTSATLAEGVAGVGMTLLALHHRTGDERLLARAAAAGDAIVGADDVTPTLGADDARGLLHGRAGLAMFLFYLARDTGESRYLDRGRRLLHDELERSIALPDGTLSFADDAAAGRALPYLYAGSAGVATVITRYLSRDPDERLAAALPQVLADADKACTMLPGLYSGLAGLAFARAEHADWAGGPADDDAAVRLATGLAKYAIPHPTGARFLGDELLRYSAELWSGGAGVLLALHRVLHGAADQFFTLDRPASSTAAVPRITAQLEAA
jgi:hypothetical protein